MMARIEMQGAEMAPMTDRIMSGEVFFELGMTYSTGREGKTDLVEAHKWFNLAAMHGYEAAATFRQEVAREMTREAVAEAQRAARSWFVTH
jgi:TPR repeat protein